MNLKVGVIFGGMSTEHDVSIKSGTSIINYLNKTKYKIHNIFIDKNGDWYELSEMKIDDKNKHKIDNIFSYLKQLDIVFPILHGKYGEDGCLQGLLEFIKVPYVGCNVLTSSISMDKVFTKIVMEKANIKQAKYVYVKRCKNNYIYVDKNFNEIEDTIDNICYIIEKKINYPMFVKPSNSGSSIGINKVNTIEELKEYIAYASQFDFKIIVEEQIIGREIECGVLGNENVKVSVLGEIKSAEDFYSYDAKYQNENSRLIIPAKIDKKKASKIKNLAIKIFKSLGGKGFARIDFFVTDNEIYFNEINTLPGFTNISMYPKLWEYSGLKIENLLDEIIKLSLK